MGQRPTPGKGRRDIGGTPPMPPDLLRRPLLVRSRAVLMGEGTSFMHHSYANASRTLTFVACSAGHRLARAESTTTISNQSTIPPVE